MPLSLVSVGTAAPTGKTDAAGGNDPAQSFDGLLAALLPVSDAVESMLTDSLPLAASDTRTEAPVFSATDAVQALLVSLPSNPALLATATGDAASENLHSLTTPATASAVTPDAPSLAPNKLDAVSARPGEPSAPAHAHKTSRTDTIADHATDRHRMDSARPDPLPLPEGGPAPGRKTEYGARLFETPAIFTAEHRAAFATTELPARQAVLPVTPAFNSAGWNQAFSAQVVWAARAQMQSASLILNPPDLGPVSIELRLDETQATASFSSVQPEVRKAIEDALPTLKTLFAEAGLNLAQADIGGGEAHARHDREGQPATGRATSATAGSATDTPVGAAAGSAMVRPMRGLLDTFA